MIVSNIPLPPIPPKSSSVTTETKYSFFVGVFPFFTTMFIITQTVSTIVEIIRTHDFSEVSFWTLFTVFWMILTLYFWGKRAFQISAWNEMQKSNQDMEAELAILESILIHIDPEVLKEKGVLMEKIKISKKH